MGAVSTHALSYIGPPTTIMKAGQWAFGATYSDSEQDVEFGPDVLDEVELDSTLGTIAVGLADHRAEFFGRVGVTEYELEGEDSDDEFAIGFGGRITTNIGRGDLEGLDWGLALHLMYYENPEDAGELYEFQLGFGPCWRPGAFILYGGPMIQMLGGDVEIPGYVDLDISEESWFGGYIGAGVDVAEHFTVTAELQATPDATAVAIGGQWRL